MNRLLITLLVTGGVASYAQAAEPVQYNMVSLSAEAHRQVVNDEATATLYIESNDANAANLSDLLNRTTADALRQAKAYAPVKAWVAGNSVFPVYTPKNKPDGWRGRAEIRLQSTDFKALAGLISKLQSTMQLADLNFDLSTASREHIETELIDEAVRAFHSRADVVAHSLSATHYKLVSMNVNTQGGVRYQPQMMAKSFAMAASAPVSEPPMESGQSQVTVGINGTVQVE